MSELPWKVLEPGEGRLPATVLPTQAEAADADADRIEEVERLRAQVAALTELVQSVPHGDNECPWCNWIPHEPDCKAAPYLTLPIREPGWSFWPGGNGLPRGWWKLTDKGWCGYNDAVTIPPTPTPPARGRRMSEPKMGEIPWSEVDVLVKSSPQYQELLAQVAALTELVRKVEWGSDYYGKTCPWCAGLKESMGFEPPPGHASDCPAAPYLTPMPGSESTNPATDSPGSATGRGRLP